MPGFVRRALVERGLMAAYRDRPPYQQNDYLGWIARAKLKATQEKRLAQMLEELARGDSYMKMPYRQGATAKKPATVKTVDDYLATLPQDQRALLENLRRQIKAAAPKAEEIISYRIPTFKYYGPLVHFLARKEYCSFIVVSKSALEGFRSELKTYVISGTTIHFSAENPLPAPLVRKIVKARIKENEAKAADK